MIHSLEVRRERIVRELAQVNREIAATEKRMSEIQARVAELNQVKAKAA